MTREEIKSVKQLQKSSKVRKEAGAYVVEGLRGVSELPKEKIRKIYLSASMAEGKKDDPYLKKILDFGLEPEILKDSILEEISATKTPQGVLAVVEMLHYTLDDVIQGEAPMLLLLENLQDPGNVGTMFRLAQGAGVAGLILCGDTADPYNPKVVRAGMGAVQKVPWVAAEDGVTMVRKLQEQGIRCYAAHLSGDSFYKADYRGGSCFLIGNEGKGLTGAITEACEGKIRIPMEGGLESLNAATAATVLVYEAYRQRHGD